MRHGVRRRDGSGAGADRAALHGHANHGLLRPGLPRALGGRPGQLEARLVPVDPGRRVLEEQQAVAKATGWRFRIINEMEDEKAPQMGSLCRRHRGRHRRRLARRRLPERLGPEPRLWPSATRASARSASSSGAPTARATRRSPSRRRTPAHGRWCRRVSVALRTPGSVCSTPSPSPCATGSRGRSLHPNGYPYSWGELALQYWQKDIGRAATFSEEQQKQVFFVDWWNYEALQDARTRAAAFLKDEAPNLGDEGRDAVLRAAALYAQEGEAAGRPGRAAGGLLRPVERQGLRRLDARRPRPASRRYWRRPWTWNVRPSPRSRRRSRRKACRCPHLSQTPLLRPASAARTARSGSRAWRA